MTCSYCQSDKTVHLLQQELSKKNQQLKRLELDLQTLNQKYVAQIEHVGNVEHEKDLVEHELEELSRHLFEEANAMVAVEKKARWKIENELTQTKEQLLAEQTQLSELRQKLLATEHLTEASKDPVLCREKDDFHHNCDHPTLHTTQLDLENLYGIKHMNSTRNTISYQNDYNNEQQQRTISMPPTPSNSDHTIAMKKKKRITSSAIDGIQLETFREYITLASSQSISTKKLNQTHYMKYCLSEDIEPCLRFGSQSKLSVKKMIDYLSRQPCFIEHVPISPNITISKEIPQQQYKPIWERFSSSATSTNLKKPFIISDICSACGRHANPEKYIKLNYQFKLDEQDHWLLIDQYCRDRLVAVCEFFVFIRNIQMGLYMDRSIEDLYIENIRLRLQMFYSRMGALPVIMSDSNHALDQANNVAKPILKDDIYLSDGSISTGPNTPEQNIISSPSPIHSAWTLESSSFST
ncbi:uncharacterized protein BX663DRAFT_539507 [Cokeromyces recurvatus]|uniref:uncharacterized protein n=1 Tax=Cokeromyces recurvatus TaxID=90255 RepID=UPI00221E9894|nr:uncharacterized protein BX663DRAFT_539507 [Cokeromyces recurvatus]KAI7908171.1 hypothetical protein BX663DRAFT_539507 [Cokeromyces recurvatus]